MIRLTDSAGNTVFVNPRYIVYMSTWSNEKGGTYMVMHMPPFGPENDPSIVVKEPIDKVASIIATWERLRK